MCIKEKSSVYMRLFLPVIDVGIQRRGVGAEVPIGKKTENTRNNSIAS